MSKDRRMNERSRSKSLVCAFLTKISLSTDDRDDAADVRGEGQPQRAA